MLLQPSYASVVSGLSALEVMGLSGCNARPRAGRCHRAECRVGGIGATAVAGSRSYRTRRCRPSGAVVHVLLSGLLPHDSGTPLATLTLNLRLLVGKVAAPTWSCRRNNVAHSRFSRFCLRFACHSRCACLLHVCLMHPTGAAACHNCQCLRDSILKLARCFAPFDTLLAESQIKLEFLMGTKRMSCTLPTAAALAEELSNRSKENAVRCDSLRVQP